MAKDVFVSYSRTRSQFASDLVNALIEADVSCWVDRSGIGPAEQWRSALREGISKRPTSCILDRAWLESTVCQERYSLPSIMARP